MNLHDGLSLILKRYLDWNKCRLDCFVGMLLALLRLKQVNLTQLALAFSSDAEAKSRYRRLQRFFQLVVFDYDVFARLTMELFDFQNQRYYLTLDRTNWQWGKKNFNILTLAVVYQGAAVPVYWLILNKKGNSNQRERIALLQRFISQFGAKGILGVLGDREFIGDQWWHWLSSKQIPYLIRIKENQLMRNRQGQFQPVKAAFSDLKIGQGRLLRKRRKIGSQGVWLSGKRLDTGELLILTGNQRFSEPFATYSLRWEIESLFQCLKGRGFHWEETRLTHYVRIKKIMALMAIAFCWAHKTGEWKHEKIKPLRMKQHGRLEQSLFRYGLDELTNTLLHRCTDAREIIRLIILFWCHPRQFEMTDLDSPITIFTG